MLSLNDIKDLEEIKGSKISKDSYSSSRSDNWRIASYATPSQPRRGIKRLDKWGL